MSGAGDVGSIPPGGGTPPLVGKVALVIGGTRGIRAAVSRRLAAAGAAVAMIYRDRNAEADAVADELRAHGSTVLALRADASDTASLIAAIDRTCAELGGLDILVTVAGLTITAPFDGYADDAFDRLFAINVGAPFVAATRAASRMPAGGRIVTIGSIVADRAPGATVALYAASKAALGGLTRGLARDFGAAGITVNLVQPGPIDTEGNPADGPHAAANRAPLAIKRHGTADEVAALVAFLVSADAGFITGATYNIDGGWSA